MINTWHLCIDISPHKTSRFFVMSVFSPNPVLLSYLRIPIHMFLKCSCMPFLLAASKETAVKLYNKKIS